MVWVEFSNGNEGSNDIYISHTLKVVDELAKTYRYVSQIGQDDALTYMRAAVMMHKFCLQGQDPFGSPFSHNCLTDPVNEEMPGFFNVVLWGPSALH